MSRPVRRSASNSGSAALTRARPATKPAGTSASAACSDGLASAAATPASKAVARFMARPAMPRCAMRRLAHLAGEHLGDMAAGDWRALPRQLAGNVHQAAELAGQHQLRLRRFDVRRLCRHHGVGDVGELHREQPAEAAASFGAGHLDQLQARHGGEQAARLLLDLQLAQARAAVVIGDAAGEGARHRDMPRTSTRNETSSCTRSANARARRSAPSSPAMRRGIVQLEHRRARAGRRHDVVEAFEGGDRLQGDATWRSRSSPLL